VGVRLISGAASLPKELQDARSRPGLLSRTEYISSWRDWYRWPISLSILGWILKLNTRGE